LDEEIENSNQNLMDSMQSTRELFHKVYKIHKIKKYLKNKLEKKYQYYFLLKI
jgi:ribosomal protein S15P/S13E